jgi:Ni,Fe-hydrogenase III component G
MNTKTRLQTAADLLAAWSQDRSDPEPHRLDVVLDRADLVAAVQRLQDERWGYLAAITGVDLGVDDETGAGVIEVLYHFCAGAAVLTLRVRVPHDDASVPTVCPVIPSASFYERELMEMLGVTVRETPNPDRLFLPDDWPDGVYPLRKDFSMEDAQPEVK